MQLHAASLPLCTFLLVLHSILATAQPASLHGLIACLERRGVTNLTTLSPNSTSDYSYWLQFSLQNLRYAAADVPKPGVVVLPRTTKELQSAVKCSVHEGWELRIRSGGHSTEGLSSTGDVANFLIIDLMNFQAIKIDLLSKTAWVQSGVTVGQLYYAISQKSSQYAFPAGLCPTVGFGGHISGGGMGLLARKYGTAADHVIDAQLVNAEGKLLNRRKMGEDLFWALRGGGGGTWGVVVAWRIRLVPVPRVTTLANLTRVGIKQLTELIYKWQTLGWSGPDDLTVIVNAMTISTPVRDIAASVLVHYLGPVNETVAVVNNLFPQLGLNNDDYRDVTWIEACLTIANAVDGNVYPDVQSLAHRFHTSKFAFKTKSDYVTTPVPKEALERAFVILHQNPDAGFMLFGPTGGQLNRIAPSEIAFPHQSDNLFRVAYTAAWAGVGSDAQSIAWTRRLYEAMTPYVSQSPRRTYVNDIDLDLGRAVNGTASVGEAASWGRSYFGDNYARLVKIKSKVDPHNVFRHAQSIPPGDGGEGVL